MSAKYNKAKGAKFETDVMKWFRKMGAVAERLRLSGAEDEGDLVVMVAGDTYIFARMGLRRQLSPRHTSSRDRAMM